MKVKSIYDPKSIESRWQKFWLENRTYKTAEKGEKEYVLGMFPYPSGDGLHVGHVRIYTGTDVLSRFLRMKDKRVLHPMGWDAFGLPTENAAIKEKINPKVLAKRNIDNFRRQMRMIGFGYDWSREFATTDPDYYRFTQWLFLKLYSIKNSKGERLIYRKKVPINWCESCKTGLANEEVLSDGTHERCGKSVVQRQTEQWLMRITDYADRLLEDLKDLDWPTGILEMQKNWIGKTKGLNIDFPLENSNIKITVWTKFWETVFGATFLVVAPEHPVATALLNSKLKIKNSKLEEVKAYVEKALQKTEQQRKIEKKDKTGVFTGLYALNPTNKEKVPVWVADYVLMDVGTAAVMGVPAHDARDFEFAQKNNLKIVQVVSYPDKEIDKKVKNADMAFEGEGVLVNSGQFDGKDAWGEGKLQMAEWMVSQGFARRQTTYHLRDWIFSRQHYWGEPIPLIYCPKCGDENGVVPVPEDQLPLELPDVEHYEPTTTGKSPLEAISGWINVKCPVCGEPARRETDTMPNWAGSCWYFLRFADPRNQKKAFAEDEIKTWLPVDWYLGGAEHAVLHLLYARFWVKAFFDLGLLSIKEPFTRLRSVGMVLGEGHAKMSKSLGNIINPDEVVSMFGADTLRIYEMFMGPWDQPIAWSTRNMAGAYRFLEKIFRLVFITDGKIGDKTIDLSFSLHKLIKAVGDDIPKIKFNTAISQLMIFVNAWLGPRKSLSTEDVGKFAKVLAPFAPHLAEEIWHNLNSNPAGSIHNAPWPEYDDSVLANEQVSIPAQINGKTRVVLEIDPEIADNEDRVAEIAADQPGVKKYLEGKKIVKRIFVIRKTINFVVE